MKIPAAIICALTLAACAGRDPQPIATVQAQDTYADCTQIRAEIEANNAKVKQLADEQGWKVAQNVSAGVVGFVLWPVWFGMDFKDAAGKEAAAREGEIKPERADQDRLAAKAIRERPEQRHHQY